MKILRDIPLHSVPVVTPGTSLADATALLEDEPLQIVVIVGDGMYMGVYTPADQTSGRIPAGSNLDDLAVGPYANGLRFVGSPEMTVAEAQERMLKHELSAMPVVANRIYKGIVTLADLS